MGNIFDIFLGWYGGQKVEVWSCEGFFYVGKKRVLVFILKFFLFIMNLDLFCYWQV